MPAFKLNWLKTYKARLIMGYMNNRGIFKIIGAIVFLLIIGFVIFWLAKSGNEENQQTNTDIQNESTIKDEVVTSKIIYATDNGYVPGILSIKKGESVTWVNSRNVDVWPASAMHPTHTAYAGVDYEAEGSFKGSKACASEGNSKDGAFDPCMGIKPGQNWTFTFNQIGTWGYHDHLASRFSGKVIVS